MCAPKSKRNTSIDKLLKLYRIGAIFLIANKDNVGFSRANNQALEIAKGEYQLLLNPDTIVEEMTFKMVCDFMDKHPEAGGLGVKMIDGKGNFLPESKRGLPTPRDAFYKIFGLSRLFPRSKRFGRYHLSFLDKNETHEIEILSGAFMLMRKDALDKVGFLDEDFFMYGEDIDLSYRIVLGGYKNYYYPETRIIHYKGESTKKSSVNYVFVFYNAMIIFAKKHFSANNAKLFALLINMAIYLRAGISLVSRFLKSLLLPAFDWALNLGALITVTHWYERNIKFEEGVTYPDDFYKLILPIYSITWVLGVALTGGYKWIYQSSRIVKGVLIGTLLVTFMYAFLDESLRFSRAIVLLGAGASFLTFYITKWLIHFFKEGHPFMGQIKAKRMVIVGQDEEAQRVDALLEHSGIQHEVVGFVGPEGTKEKGFLGTVRQLNDVVNIHNIDEVIFCSKDLKSSDIFNLMLSINRPDVFFKIVPEESIFIIGSNSKNTPGDYYTIDVKLALKSPENQFNKRVVDILVSLILVATLPLSVWFVDSRQNFVRNLLNVIVGRLTWVGYSSSRISDDLPYLRKGVLKPIDRYHDLELEVKAINRIDLAYARNYHFTKDLEIILKGFSRLGTRV